MPTDTSSREFDIALDSAAAAIWRMFEQYQKDMPDDRDFLPLVGCVIDGLADALELQGLSKKKIALFRDEPLLKAYEKYLEIRQKSDPDCDTEAVWRSFARMMGRKRPKSKGLAKWKSKTRRK